MAFNWGQWLPYIIMGGSSVVSSIFGARAQGKSAEVAAQGAELASQTQLQMSREQLQQLREIYNLDLSLNWPRHRLASESLGKLARGVGSELPASAFETPEEPPALPGAGPGLGSTEGGAQDPFGAIASGFQTPGGGGPSALRSTAGGAITGASLGSLAGPIGMGVGAGVGAMTGLFGRGRKEADFIVPYQNELTRRIGLIGSELARRIKDGTVTDQDWIDAANAVRSMRDSFYSFSDQHGRAGPGARQTIDAWVGPMLQAWGTKATNWPKDWSTWRPPSRQFGGPVGGMRSLPMMSKPQYLVGEAGPEMYVPDQGQPFMVGMGGPSVFAPPQDGHIVPNHQLTGQRTYTLSNLGNGLYELPSRQEGGRVTGQKRVTPYGNIYWNGQAWVSESIYKRQQQELEDGASLADEPSPTESSQQTAPEKTQQTAPEKTQAQKNRDLVMGWGWRDLGGNNWYHEETGFRGYWVDDNMFVSPDAIDPQTGGRTGATFKVDEYRKSGKDADFLISDENRKYEGQDVITQWGWRQDDQGNWFHAGEGSTGTWANDYLFYSPETDQYFDRRTGKLHQGKPPGYVELGEFLNEWEGDFSFDPASSPQLMEPFEWDPAEHGFMPFNQEFSYDPAEHGFTPLSRQFEFDTDDLFEDPGYQFRLAEGNKAIQRSAAARGFLQSGRTLKDLGRWSQGLAAQEYGDAYGRALGEFGLSRRQSLDAYNQALERWTLGQGQTYGAYDRALQNWGLQYGMTGDAYNRAWSEYQNRRQEWEANRRLRYQTFLQTQQL